MLTCQGQKIEFPQSIRFDRIYILAAPVRDTNVILRAGDMMKNIRVQGYTGKIGQFDLRLWDKYGRIKGNEPGFIKRDEVAFFTTHAHQDTLNMPHQYIYVL